MQRGMGKRGGGGRKKKKGKEDKNVKRKRFDEHQERNKLDQITVLMRAGLFL